VDLTGHHSNPSRPLQALLDWGATANEGRDSATKPPPRIEPKCAAGSIGAAHRRHDWVQDAVIRVIERHKGSMQARDVNAAVEALLGESVRWGSVKACLAANVAGPSPRFVRVAPGRYASGRAPRLTTTSRCATYVALIHHGDAGSQYLSYDYTQTLDDHGVLASIGTVGDALDNAVAESFVDSFKTELIADRTWATRSQLELAVVEYVAWFNNERLHEALEDRPPREVEELYAAKSRQRSRARKLGNLQTPSPWNPGRLKQMLGALVFAGLRIGELIALDWRAPGWADAPRAAPDLRLAADSARQGPGLRDGAVGPHQPDDDARALRQGDERRR
jgi:Integrase core domain